MTTPLTVPVTAEMKDFSVRREPIKFTIDDDVFEAVPEVAAEVIFRLADQLDRLTDDDGLTVSDQLALIHGMFRALLLPKSADLFIFRMSNPARPIGVEQFKDVLAWLMERYGLRPTESDSAS